MSGDSEMPAQSAVHTQSIIPQEGLPVPISPNAGDNEKEQMAKIAEDGCTPAPGAWERQGWNNPKVNMWRFMATIFSFLVLGANDAAVGALIPYIEEYYSISYTVVATIFLSPVAGYSLSAVVINKIHMHYGQFGIAIIAPTCKIITYVITCIHPPFPVIPIIFVLSGMGNGLEDGSWNAWVGGLRNTNELMGLLHGAYGLGAAVGPLISTAMVTKGGLQWYTWYYVMVGAAAMEMLLSGLAFKEATGSKFRAANPVLESQTSRTREAMTHRLTWIISLFLFAYVGVEVAVGGWIVTFMLENRAGEPFASGMVATGFWFGLTVGRVVLGFITGRIGEKLAIVIYLLSSIVLELLFWLIPSFVSSAVFVSFLGFFLGPLFPAAIVVATKLLPRRLHVSAVGFVAALGSSGAAVFPFAVGAIAQARGVGVLQPFALALIALILILWCVLPGGFKKNGLDIAEAKMLEAESTSASETPQV